MSCSQRSEDSDELLADLIDDALLGAHPDAQSSERADCPELAGLFPIINQLRKLAELEDWKTSRASEGGTLPTIGKYQVLSFIGRGGQSAVFLAQDPDLERRVILKLYHNEGDVQWIESLLNEGRLLARLQCPYVARCIAIERVGDLPYLVLEYIPGRTLAELIASQMIPIDAAIELTKKIVIAVTEIHAAGLIHGDLKPSNVVVGHDGDPRIVDFGLSTYVLPIRSGLRGTESYMAPELLSGEISKPDVRTDIYSFGMLLYEMLTGERPPCTGLSGEKHQTFHPRAIKRPDEANRQVPAWLSDLCMRCLERRPLRYSSAAELLAAFCRPQSVSRKIVAIAGVVTLCIAVVLASLPRTKVPHKSPETFVLGKQWTISSWFKCPLPNGGNWIPLAANGDRDFPIVALVRSEAGAPGWLGTYDRDQNPRFQNSGVDIRTLTDGWHQVVVVGIPQSDGDPGVTNFYLDGELVGSIGSTKNDEVGNQIQNETIDLKITNKDQARSPAAPHKNIQIFERSLTSADVRDLYSLAGHWTFDGPTPASPQPGLHHSSSGAPRQYCEGPIGYGQALSLTASNGAKASAEGLELLEPVELGEDWTFSAWYLAPLTRPSQHPLITLTKSAGTTSEYQIIARWENSGALRLGRTVDGGPFEFIPNFDLAEKGGAPGWHHLAAVACNGHTTFYVDGNEVGFVRGQSQTNIKYVGTDPMAGGEPFAQGIDDVRIYDRALSRFEIRELHSLIGHWRFEHDLSDSSPQPLKRNLVCTAQGPTRPFVFEPNTDRRFGAALNLGSSPPLKLSEPLRLPKTWTVAAWFHWDTSGDGQSDQAPVVRFLTADDTSGKGLNGHVVLQKANGKCRLGYSQDGNLLLLPEINDQSITTGWHHIAAVRTFNAEIIFYLDGIKQGTLPHGYESIVTHIGALPGNEDLVHDRIDDARIYNRRLSNGEIRDLFGLISLWEFEGNVRDTAPYGRNHGLTTGSYVIGSPGDGRALHLAEHQRLELLDPVELGSEWTIGARFQGLVYPGDGREKPISFTKSSSATTVDHQIIGYWEDSETLRLGMYVNGKGYRVIPDYNLKTDAAIGWHSIVAVGKDGQTKYYIDGVFRGVVEMQSTSDVKYIGADPLLRGNRFANVIDDVRIYDYALSNSAVASLYQN